MRRIAAIALAGFAAFTAETASATSYTFSVQVTTRYDYDSSNGSQSETPLSQSFMLSFSSDPASPDAEYTLANSFYSYANVPVSSATATPFTSALQQLAFGGAAPDSEYGNSSLRQYAPGLNSFSMGWQMNTSSGGVWYVEVDASPHTAAQATAPIPSAGAYTSFLNGLVGTSFSFLEHGSDGTALIEYGGSATLVSIDEDAPNAVPEPSSLLAIGSGVLAAGAARRRRQRAA